MFGCFWCQSKDDFYLDSKKCRIKAYFFDEEKDSTFFH